MIATDAIEVDADGNPVSLYGDLFKTTNQDGKEVVVREKDSTIDTADGDNHTVTSLIAQEEQGQHSLTEFITDKTTEFGSSFKDYLDDNKDYIIGDVLARVALGESLDDAFVAVAEVWGINALLNNSTSNSLLNGLFGADAEFSKGNGLAAGHYRQKIDANGKPMTQQVRDAHGNVKTDLFGKPIEEPVLELTSKYKLDANGDPVLDANGKPVENSITSSEVAAGVKAGVVSFLTTILLSELRGEDPNSSDYTAAGLQAAGITAMTLLLPEGTPVGIIMTVIDASVTAIEEHDEFDSQGWQDFATSTAAALAAAYAGMKIGAAIGSGAGPVGTAVGAVVGAIVGALIYVPLANYFKAQFENFEEIYDSVEDIFKGDSFEENAKQAIKALEDYFINAPKDLILDLGRGIMTLFGGGYGMEFGDGEYPDPYSLLKVVAKPDGSGNLTYVLEEGAVARARDGFDDDIVGSGGNDVLVGGSGTNAISGNRGNDHIEGRDSDDQLLGGEGNDLIEAGGGDDIISGDEGADIIYGGSGADTIDGGTGSDVIIAGSGDDIVTGGSGDNFIFGDEGDDQLAADGGDDTLVGGTGDDILAAGSGRDRLYGGEGADMLLGDAGNDIVVGGLGNDNLYGGADDDYVIGGAGVDILHGDIGNDVLSGGDEGDLLLGGLGNDQLGGAAGDDSILGEIGDDAISGGTGNDTIDGGDGLDVISGDEGDDIIAGGAGSDLYIFAAGDGADEITDESGEYDVLRFIDLDAASLTLTKQDNDLIISFGNTDQVTLKDSFTDNSFNPTIESLEFVTTGVTGGQSLDLSTVTYDSGTDNFSFALAGTIDEDISTQAVILEDTKGVITALDNFYHDKQGVELNPNETLYDNVDYEFYNEVEWRSFKRKRSAFGGHYTVWYKYYEKYINGTDGVDRLVGNFWDEIIYGKDGGDYLYGNNGNDVLYGQEGDDFLEGGAGNDRLEGGIGNDTLEGASGNDTLNAGAGDDTILAGEGNDTINSGSGNDKIIAEFGNNQITVLDGNNYIEAGNGTDTITALDGDNDINAGDGNNKITVGDGDNLIESGNGNDQVIVGDGNNSIHTAAGNDEILVGDGDNFVNAGLGDDILNIGDGNNIIYAGSGDDVLNVGSGNNSVYLGSGDDELIIGLGDNKIFADSGNNIINVVANNNSASQSLLNNNAKINTAAGHDIISVIGSEAQINSGLGDDNIYVTNGDFIIESFGGNNIIDVAYADAQIFVGDGDNQINLKKEALEFDKDYYIENYREHIPDYGLGESENAKRHFHEVGKYRNYNPNQFFDTSYYLNSLNTAGILLAENQTAFDHFVTEGFQMSLEYSSAVIANDISVNAGEGNNSIYGSNVAELINVGNGNNIINSDAGSDIVSVGDGDNLINLGTGDDKLTTGAGNNIIYSGEGNNDIIFGNGDNQITLGNGQNTLTAGNGNNKITSGSGSDQITVGTGNNEINSGAGDDIITTNGGDNVIVAGLGDDTINGGSGNDTYHYNLGDGNDTITEISGADELIFNDLLASDLDFEKQDNDLVLRVKSNGQAVTLANFFLASATSIETLTFKDGYQIHLGEIFVGTNNQDEYQGSEEGEQALLLAGNDIVFGHGGDDYLEGDEGNDLIFAGTGDDVAEGGAGDDYIDAGAGNDQLVTGSGNDNLLGGTGNDEFVITKSAGAKDIINDFNVAEDTLNLSGFGTEFLDLESLINLQGYELDNKGDVVLNLGEEQQLTLTGIKPKNLTDLNITFSAQQVEIATEAADEFTLSSSDNVLRIIEDFDAATDTIKLEDFSELAFAEVNISEQNGNSILSFANGQKLILRDISSSELNESNFKFDIFNGTGSHQRYSGSKISVIEIDTVEGNFDSEINYFTSDVASAGVGNATNFFSSSNARNQGVRETISNTRSTNFSASDYSFRIEEYGCCDTRKVKYFDPRNHTMHGASWSENIWGKKGNDLIFANNGNDKVWGGSGNDEINGGNGNDTIYGESGHDYVRSGSGNDYISGGNNNDYILGESGNDKIYGGSGLDYLSGGSGDDLLKGDSSSDYLIAGDGNDSLYGDSGDDFLIGGAGNDYLEGGTGNDILEGNQGADTLRGNDGQDVLFGGEDDDKLYGDSGDDYLDGGYGADEVYGGTGNDYIIGSLDASDDFYSGGDGHDKIIAFAGNNLIDGGAGYDQIQGGTGNDTIFGNSGGDDIKGGAGNDLIYAGTNYDKVEGEAGNDHILGGQGADQLSGGAGDDLILGGTEDDIIAGDAGNDRLEGEEGNDTLVGGTGNDQLVGGIGDDTYLFASDLGVDVIDELANEGTDKIQFAEGIDLSDLTLIKEGNDLKIMLDEANNLTITDQFLNNEIKVETLEFADGTSLDLGTEGNDLADAIIVTDNEGNLNSAAAILGSFININEDEQIKISLASGLALISSTSAQGALAQIDHELIFTPTENFNGLAELSFSLEDTEGLITDYNFNISINPINDAPTTLSGDLGLQTLNEDSDLTIDILAEYADAEGEDLTLAVGRAKHGLVELLDNDQVKYTPNADYYGSDSFTYIVRDTNGSTVTKTLELEIANVGDAPIVVDTLEVSTKEDKAITIDPVAHSYDADGDQLTITKITSTPLNGIAEIIDNQIIYTPNADYNGTDNITYVISDGTQQLTKNITLEVTPENDAPVVLNSSTEVQEDGSVIVDIFRDVVDIDGDELNIVSISPARNGAAEIISNKIVYTPNDNYHGVDSIIYTITDGTNYITKELAITVNAVNDLPIVESVSTELNEDNIVTIDPLKNAYDIDGDELTLVNVADTEFGYTTIVDGQILYLPNENFNGSDIVEFTISDGTSEVTKTININVTEVNDLPVATLTEATLNEDSDITIDVLSFASDADGDELTLTGISAPQYGIANIVNGQIVYSPVADYYGNDSFSYFISDGNGGLISQTMSLTINNVNDAPEVNISGEFNVVEDGNIEIDILGNVTDIDSGDLFISEVSEGINGLVVLDGGKITYAPNQDYYGQEVISYKLSDGEIELEKELTINVASINDNPEAGDDTYVTSEDQGIVLDILNNDFDIEDSELKRENIVLGGAMHGVVSLNEFNQIVYRPNNHYNGADQFVYSVKDSNGALSNLATVNIDVTAVNDAPILFRPLADQMARAEQTRVINLRDNIFKDVEGDDLTIDITLADGSALPAWLVYNEASGVLTVNATSDDSGVTDLQITASDGELETSQKFTLVVKEKLTVRNDERINVVEGGEEADLVVAETGNTDLIFAGDGDDEIVYNMDDLWGSGYYAENSYTGERVALEGKIRSFDAFDGGEGDEDTLYLTDGDDSIFLHDLISDNPTISGSRLFGVEVINALDGSDVIDLSSNIFTYGSVTINGSDGDDVLWSNDGNDELNGAGGNDNLNGGRGSDILDGGAGDDYLHGYTGDDTLIGGLGSDILFGGTGSDIFKFTDFSESTISSADIIQDFEQGIDLIEIANTSFTDLEISNDNGNTQITVTGEDFMLELEGIFNLTQDDFLVA